MSNAIVVTTCLVLAGAVSVAVNLALAPADDPASGDERAAAVEPGDLTRERAERQRLEARVGELEAALAALRARPAAPPARLSRDELDAAVARALAGRGEVAAAPESAVEGDDLARVPVEDLVERLLAGDAGRLSVEELWQAVREAGRTDEVLAAFEARAAAAPNDPAVQVELGEAYLQKIAEVGNGPLAGVFASRADAAFDRALELEPGHWEARFQKAVALSFWPPVLGKQGEAIAQFETLVAQQAGLAPTPDHAQTHLLLGNMYLQTGHPDKALAAWQAGIAIFPDHEALLAQLALAQAQGGD